jgi:hypothetical protein
LCACPKTRTWISNVICRSLFYVEWFEMRGDCLFCLYWWHCWPSLFKLSFHNSNYLFIYPRLAAASDKVYQLLVHGRWFSPGTPATSTTKTGRHHIAEILLKVALSTINHIIIIIIYLSLSTIYFNLYRSMKKHFNNFKYILEESSLSKFE